jgi:hypothetical protein
MLLQNLLDDRIMPELVYRLGYLRREPIARVQTVFFDFADDGLCLGGVREREQRDVVVED